jgi:hypothetical protein
VEEKGGARGCTRPLERDIREPTVQEGLSRHVEWKRRGLRTPSSSVSFTRSVGGTCKHACAQRMCMRPERFISDWHQTIEHDERG